VIQEASTLNGIEMNALSSMEMLKSNHFEGIFFKNWASHHDDLQNRTQKNALVNQNFSLIITFLTGLMSLCLLYSGVHLVLSGVMTIGTLMAFTSLIHYVDDPLVTLLSFFGNLEKIKADIYRLHDILFYGASIKKNDNTSKNAKQLIETIVENQPLIGITRKQIQHVIEEGIVFHDVSFGYAPLDPPLLLKTNLVIQKGKTTALVGMSGSGKSTISKILCGLYSPSSGIILWNGSPLANEDASLPNQKLSLVDQDIFLFEGRVRDNLTLWRDDIPEEILLKAIQDVGLFNDLLPRGLLDAYVEENGMNFSGGQRQRLEIARALVSQPDLLILDEATSALDTISEEAILNALKDSKRTILVIAHRLSTIKNADIIYVLDQGRVVQCGGHEKLVQMPGLYHQLVTIEEAS
jgi:ATP-binding cassette subfamily C protein